MDKKSIEEMQQIQKGLEDFLEKELAGEKINENSRRTVKQEPKLEQEPKKVEVEKIIQEAHDKEEDDTDESEDDLVDEDWITEDWDEDARRERAARKRRKSGNEGSARSERNIKNAERPGSTGKINMKNKKPVKKKKKSKLKRFLLFLLMLILILGIGWYYVIGKLYGQMVYQEATALTGEPMKADGVTNILLIGNDSRENGEDGRSDAMILLSVSNKTKTIHMTSLLRDMYVEIPGHDGNRLNAAYAYGGAELLMETIENNLDITVNRYALVNFQAFANLVDAVGGVDLELTNEEVQYVNGYLVEYNMLTNRPEGTDYLDSSLSGMIHLNGSQALAYSRNRYLGTDFGRTERQRKVLAAVIQGAPKALLTNPKELIEGILPNLTTNLTQGECFELSIMAPKLLTYDIIQGSIPIEGSYKNATIRKMSVLEVDWEANKAYIQENIYGTGGTQNEP